MASEVSDLTACINRAFQGDKSASDHAFGIVYQEMHLIAQRYWRSNGPDPFEPTAVVHEAYIRLIDKNQISISERRHFFMLATRAMRDIVVERYRYVHAAKRGGGRIREQFNDDLAVSPSVPGHDLLEVSDAIKVLAVQDPEAAEFIMLRFFAGMNFSQIGEILELSRHAVRQRWAYARASMLAILERSQHEEKE